MTLTLDLIVRGVGSSYGAKEHLAAALPEYPDARVILYGPAEAAPRVDEVAADPDGLARAIKAAGESPMLVYGDESLLQLAQHLQPGLIWITLGSDANGVREIWRIRQQHSWLAGRKVGLLIEQDADTAAPDTERLMRLSRASRALLVTQPVAAVAVAEAAHAVEAVVAVEETAVVAVEETAVVAVEETAEVAVEAVVEETAELAAEEPAVAAVEAVDEETAELAAEEPAVAAVEAVVEETAELAAEEPAVAAVEAVVEETAELAVEEPAVAAVEAVDEETAELAAEEPVVVAVVEEPVTVAVEESAELAAEEPAVAAAMETAEIIETPAAEAVTVVEEVPALNTIAVEEAEPVTYVKTEGAISNMPEQVEEKVLAASVAAEQALIQRYALVKEKRSTAARLSQVEANIQELLKEIFVSRFAAGPDAALAFEQNSRKLTDSASEYTQLTRTMSGIEAGLAKLAWVKDELE